MGVVRKLRRFHDAETLKRIYDHMYNPNVWPEHKQRIETTAAVANQLIADLGLKTCADYSAGNRALALRLRGLTMLDTCDYFGSGRMEERIDEMEPVDLYLCTETIEHLEAPWTVLEKLATKARQLVLSTPLDENPKIGNYEHYWSFTEEDVEQMLWQSGWAPHPGCPTILFQKSWTYTYQIWTAKSVCIET